MFVILGLSSTVKYFPDFLWQNRSRLKGAVGLLGTHTESLPQGHCSCLSQWPNESRTGICTWQVFCKAQWPKTNLTLFRYEAAPSLDSVSDVQCPLGLFVCFFVYTGSTFTSLTGSCRVAQASLKATEIFLPQPPLVFQCGPTLDL